RHDGASLPDRRARRAGDRCRLQERHARWRARGRQAAALLERADRGARAEGAGPTRGVGPHIRGRSVLGLLVVRRHFECLRSGSVAADRDELVAHAHEWHQAARHRRGRGGLRLRLFLLLLEHAAERAAQGATQAGRRLRAALRLLLLRALTLRAANAEAEARLYGIALQVERHQLLAELAPDALVAAEHRLRALGEIARRGSAEAELLRVRALIRLHLRGRFQSRRDPLVESHGEVADLPVLLVLARLRRGNRDVLRLEAGDQRLLARALHFGLRIGPLALGFIDARRRLL